MLEPRAGRDVNGSPQRRDKRQRRIVERAGPEDEDEAAVSRIAPFDIPNARHARRNHAAEDVEPYRVAHLESGALTRLPLDRDLEVR